MSINHLFGPMDITARDLGARKKGARPKPGAFATSPCLVLSSLTPGL